MTARELFEAIGLVDEDLIADADAPVRRRWTPRLVLRRALPLAACLCVAAGAVIAWRIAPWQGMTGSSIQSEAAAAPDLAAAPEQSGAGEDGGESAAAAPKETDERDSLAAGQAGIPAEQEQWFGGTTGGMGGMTLLAADAAELAVTDVLDGETPETLTVYRGTLASMTIDEDRIRETLRTVLAAMGQDTALADTAELNWHIADVESTEDALALAEKIQTKQADARGMLDFWGGACSLEATLPDGSTLSVINDGTVRWWPSGDAGWTDAEVAANVDTILDVNAGLLEALGGCTTVIPAPTDRRYADGGESAVGIWLAPGGDTASEKLFGRDMGALFSLQADENGVLTGFQRFGNALAEPIGEYSILSRESAEALLQQGVHLDAAYSDNDPAEGAVVDAQLCYLRGRAYYYVPMWCFTVDLGEAEAPAEVSEEAAGLGLHAYQRYYVPAIDLDTLADIIAADQAG